MKKPFYFILLGLCQVLILNAQVKVTSSGDVFVRRINTSGQAVLSVDSVPGMTNNYYDGWKMGIRSYGYNSSITGNTIGVFGEGFQQYDNHENFSAGMLGMAGGAYEGMNYGIIGVLHSGEYGTGIYGSNCDDAFYGLGSNSLAGYFYGPVHVVGSVYSTVGFSSPSDIRLKRDIETVASTEVRKGSTLRNLASLEVLNYRLEFPEKKRALIDNSGKFNDPNVKIESLRHYGVSAQELQKLYPDLVIEGQDGYLFVNYVEMVPLLLRSIQELKQELDEVKGSNPLKTRSRLSSVAGTEVSATGNVLYQNSPNPFKEHTAIRFFLTNDVNEAFVCIFDMTGKMLKKLPVSSGETCVTVNGWELGEGMFLYSLLVNGREIDTKRMIITE